MLTFENDRHTINSLSRLTSKGKCWLNMEQGRSVIRVTFGPSHPYAHRGYARVLGSGVSFSRDENGNEMPWARAEREAHAHPSSNPCRNHNKRGCTADGCF